MNIGKSYITINQTNDCLVSTKDNKFVIYNTHPFKINFKRIMSNDIHIIKMFYRTNILIIVEKRKLNELILWDDNERKVVGKILLNKNIINFETNRELIVITTDDSLHIYTFNNISLKKKINTIKNDNGIIILYGDIIVYPNKEVGHLTVMKYNSNYNMTFKCHNSNIRIITINNDGSLIATCSEHGTIIRIFNIEDGKLLKEFRRGITYSIITDLKFNMDSSLLLCNSCHNTVHIYCIKNNNKSYLPEYSMAKIYNDLSVYCVFLPNNDLLSISDSKFIIYSAISNYENILDENYN